MTVVAPQSVAELAATVRQCAAAGTALRPRGSGYEMAAGNPVEAPVTIHTGRLDEIRQFDPDELVIRVGAGVTMEKLHATLSEHRLRAVVPQRPTARTIGGVIASGASGYERLRYGPVRNHVIGMTLVSGGGDVVEAGGRVVKNVTGFDLSRLCVGSFGRLGVITEVGLRVFPRRGSVAVIAVEEPEAAWRGSARPLAVVGTRDGALALVEGSDEAIDSQVTLLKGELRDGAELPSPEEWSWRATVRSRPSEQPGLLLRLPAHWDYIAQYGVGLTEVGGSEAVVTDDLASVRAAAEATGGRLVIHRLPEAQRASIDAWGAPPPDMVIQRRIVASFDPHGIFNPGILPEGL